MKTLQVELQERSYPIWIGSGAVSDRVLWEQALASGRVVVVTNTTVGPLYARAIEGQLRGLGRDVFTITLPD